MEETDSKVDSLVSKGDNDRSEESSTAKSKGKNHNGSSNFMAPKFAKLDFSRFRRDEDPTSWICRVEQLFDYQ
jgi:hypothetical protein